MTPPSAQGDGRALTAAVRTATLFLTRRCMVAKVAVSRMTSKGQVTIPEEIRRQVHLQAGEEVEWEVTDRGTVELRKAGGTLEALTQVLPRPKRAVTVSRRWTARSGSTWRGSTVLAADTNVGYRRTACASSAFASFFFCTWPRRSTQIFTARPAAT